MRDALVPLLEAHLDAFRGAPFVYGESDCVMFAAGWLKACGLHVPVPVYSSLKEGLGILAALELDDWIGAVDQVLQRRPVLQVRIGDLVSHSENRALGICVGGPRAAFLGIESGVRFESLSKCACAWSVEPCQA